MKAEAETKTTDVTITMAICYCGRGFVVLDDQARCCSPDCRRVWEAVHHGREPDPQRLFELTLRRCRVCGESFVVKVPHQRCCSKPCTVMFDNYVK